MHTHLVLPAHVLDNVLVDDRPIARHPYRSRPAEPSVRLPKPVVLLLIALVDDGVGWREEHRTWCREHAGFGDAGVGGRARGGASGLGGEGQRSCKRLLIVAQWRLRRWGGLLALLRIRQRGAVRVWKRQSLGVIVPFDAAEHTNELYVLLRQTRESSTKTSDASHHVAA